MPALRKHASPAKRQLAYRQRREAARIADMRAKGLLRTVHQEMEDYCDTSSEAWQESEKGEAFQATLDLVSDALASVEAIE